MLLLNDKAIRLIVGLGNPGVEYDNTRHNMGFLVVRAFAEKRGFSFKRAFNGIADVAQGQLDGKKVVLLLPLTYMNTSGRAVRLFVDYFKLASENVLVVSDDVALPFEKLRLRLEGSAGGHNGLKSIEAHLGTQKYARLRIGVGDPAGGDLAQYVLGQFTAEERLKMPEVTEKAIAMIDLWLSKVLSA